MKKLRFSTKARKDLKRYRNQPERMRRLFAVIDVLLKDERLPEAFKMHGLSGRYTGCLECHVENDFLLIWRDEEETCLYVLRVGTHSELFGS